MTVESLLDRITTEVDLWEADWEARAMRCTPGEYDALGLPVQVREGWAPRTEEAGPRAVPVAPGRVSLGPFSVAGLQAALLREGTWTAAASVSFQGEQWYGGPVEITRTADGGWSARVTGHDIRMPSSGTLTEDEHVLTVAGAEHRMRPRSIDLEADRDDEAVWGAALPRRYLARTTAEFTGQGPAPENPDRPRAWQDLGYTTSGVTIHYQQQARQHEQAQRILDTFREAFTQVRNSVTQAYSGIHRALRDDFALRPPPARPATREAILEWRRHRGRHPFTDEPQQRRRADHRAGPAPRGDRRRANRQDRRTPR